mmetsp:Transcript_38337/g.81247  ORF Transcript_38337/g.81247 Transcript_38337/m.81247 type:complete len:236 (+) Transcript_38337:892-1599(+)
MSLRCRRCNDQSLFSGVPSTTQATALDMAVEAFAFGAIGPLASSVATKWVGNGMRLSLAADGGGSAGLDAGDDATFFCCSFLLPLLRATVRPSVPASALASLVSLTSFPVSESSGSVAVVVPSPFAARSPSSASASSSALLLDSLASFGNCSSSAGANLGTSFNEGRRFNWTDTTSAWAGRSLSGQAHKSWLTSTANPNSEPRAMSTMAGPAAEAPCREFVFQAARCCCCCCCCC